MTKKLTKKQLQQFKQLFLLQQKEIIASLRSETELPDIEGDETDVIQGVILNTISQELSLRDKTKLRVITEALEKIEAGTFGKCEECDDAIPFKRLEALPACKVCVFCAEKQELESKLYIKK